ncbi:MAG: hypothetical protein ACKO2T_11670, partial [Microcystis aeruginosa]
MTSTDIQPTLYNKKYLQRMISPVSMQHPSLTRFEPATTLDEIYLTISPEPLLTQKEIDAFYREEMNKVRGEDKIE